MMERFCLSVDDETCAMICVTPYVVEAHSAGSKTEFRCMGWLRIGIGIVMPRYERWRERGVRHMVLRIQRHEEHTDGGSR